MHIGVLPYELRYEINLGVLAIDTLEWLDDHKPPGMYLSDLQAEDHVVVYPSSSRLLKGFGNIKCHVDLLLAEPMSIHGKYYKLIWMLRHKFSNILCRYPSYVSKYANVIQFNPVETWIDDKQLDLTLLQSKAQSCSIIASSKTDLEGHKLRHQVVQAVRQEGLDVKVLGRGYEPFEEKWQGLLPFQYSIVIENEIEPHYFTEKILDAMVCETIPIYWGTANIGEYFDTNGMYVCHSFADIMAVVRDLPIELDQSMRQAVEHNRQVALSYTALYQRIGQAVYKHLNCDN